MTNNSLLNQKGLQGESQRPEFIWFYCNLEQRSIIDTVNTAGGQNYNWRCSRQSDIKSPNIRNLTMTSQT